jgi:hypothetical protein
MSIEAIKAYLLARVAERPGGCWIWSGNLDRKGYPVCKVNGRQRRAARLAYEAWICPIPRQYDAHHTCGRRNCINPGHISPLAHAAHIRLHANSGAWAGAKNSQAKLSEADAQFIRTAGTMVSARNLADQFGVSERTIYNIRSGGGWPHVETPDFSTRSIEEVLQAGRRASQKALDVLLRVQQDRRERRTPLPPFMSEVITLARIACAVW